MKLYSQPPIGSFQPTIIPDDVPVYRIKEGKFFGVDENMNDRLYEEGSIIAWNEEPNLEMEPLNEMAFDAMKAYVDKLDKYGKAAAEKAGKSYISLADAFDNAYALANQEGKRVTLLNGPREVPIMGAKRRGRKSAKSIEINRASAEPVHDLTGKKSVNKINDKGL